MLSNSFRIIWVWSAVWYFCAVKRNLLSIIDILEVKLESKRISFDEFSRWIVRKTYCIVFANEWMHVDMNRFIFDLFILKWFPTYAENRLNFQFLFLSYCFNRNSIPVCLPVSESFYYNNLLLQIRKFPFESQLSSLHCFHPMHS